MKQYFFNENVNGLYYLMSRNEKNLIEYYPATELPIGLNPHLDRNGALYHLIKQYTNVQHASIHTAISLLNPNMKDWTLSEFTNYLGNADEAEYSMESDDEELPSATELAMSTRILQRTEKPRSASLATRLQTLVTKIAKATSSVSSVGRFNSSSTQRQAYFPRINDHAINANIAKNEIDLINSAVTNEQNVIKKIKGQLYWDNGTQQTPITTPFIIPLFRGISYLTDRWGNRSRRAHVQLPLEKDHNCYSEAVIKTATEDYYHLTDYTAIDEQQLHRNAKTLKSQLLSFKMSEPVILSDKQQVREFANFIEYLQYSFSNGIENFLKHIDIFNQHFPQALPNAHNPFLPFSHLAFHAVRYALGEKNPYKPYALEPLWDTKGKARRRHVGKLVISLHSLDDFLKIDEPNVVPYLSRKSGVVVPKNIGAEYEVSFFSFIPREKLFKSYKIRFPNFHKPYSVALGRNYLAKYGLTEFTYKEFQKAIRNPHTQQEATEALKTWLTLFYAIKAMEDVAAYTQDKAVLLFRHPDGTFHNSYPNEDYQNSGMMTANINNANNHVSQSLPLFTDTSSYSKPRTLSTVNQTPTPPSPLSKNCPSPKKLSPERKMYAPVSPSKDAFDNLGQDFNRLLTLENNKRGMASLISKSNPLFQNLEESNGINEEALAQSQPMTASA